MNDKTKKLLLFSTLSITVIGLAIGIKHSLALPKTADTPVMLQNEESPDVIVNQIKISIPELTVEPKQEYATKKATSETKLKESFVASPQKIQEDPVKTEKEKPTAPPEEAKKVEKEKPAEEPKKEEKKSPNESENKPKPKEPAPAADTPKDGEIKDGQIYILGFGWVPYEGGGTSGIQDEEMYENGNKIGIMD